MKVCDTGPPHIREGEKLWKNFFSKKKHKKHKKKH